ncbi:MAG: hypothetical protein OEV06_04520 [Anaerolineae bacterium]|nr:hypothetical protein [Anaerolineae bacterium]
MSWTNRFSGLNFEQQPRRLSPRLVAIGITILLYLLGWRLIPAAALFWFGLLGVAALGWIASFGWREAVAVLIRWLERLERI